ncbi:MAG: BTAD domain-containing putative transcriptional regulator [Nitriliruptorales bacterium]|nr:BTAD domain-containing putative transcriptional regulator [Nitriliruptorales bacterium]
MDDQSQSVPGIRLLGSVDIVADGVEIGGPKQQLVLALLAVHVGQVVPTDVLVAGLWPDEPPATPERSLQVYVSKLRSLLDDAGIDGSIEHRGHGYVLETDPDVVDAQRFERLTREGIAAIEEDAERAGQLLRDALGMWGRPLGGLSDQPGLRAESTRLEDLRLRGLEARIAADLEMGRHDDVADELRRYTRDHPLRERLWGQLMVALYRSGRQGEALEAYETARRTLAEELGADPSPALQRLHGRILEHDPGLAVPAPRQERGAAVEQRSKMRPSVAILPFEIIGAGEDIRFLALGLHNDLVTELSKVRELTVISRTSVMGYQGTGKRVPEIARELDVGTVVEGAVQTAGSRFRLTVQLIDAQRDDHRWAQNYDRELTTEDLFAIQTELTRDIARSLLTELSPDAQLVGEDRPPTGSLEAYRLAAEARQQFELKTGASFRRAVELYEQALELDPDYVQAWVGLADALASMDAYGHGDRHELLPRAERAAHRALALDPGSAAARTSLGVLHVVHQDGPAALRELGHALQIQPDHADAHNWHSWVSLLLGQAEAGFDHAVRAVELDPRSAEAVAHVALAHAASGRPADGLTEARRAGELSPYATADLYQALCLSELGRHEEVRRVLEPLSDVAPPAVPWSGYGAESMLALALIGLGQRGAARSVLSELDPAVDPFGFGLILLGLGDEDEAARSFARADRLTAWPTLVVHHYFGDLWARTPALHGGLVTAVRQSWRAVKP